VRPTTGESCGLLLPAVDAAMHSVSLEHVASELGPATARRVVSVLDRAGSHTGKGLRVPAGIELALLPARSPELQPAEPLWPLANEGVANTLFAYLDALAAARATQRLARAWQPELMRSPTRNHR
jgi:hypothetical protein